jgi:hypothetical protein
LSALLPQLGLRFAAAWSGSGRNFAKKAAKQEPHSRRDDRPERSYDTSFLSLRDFAMRR